jgi:hypothetical protein
MASAEGIVPVADIPSTVNAVRLAGMLHDESARILTNWSMRITTLPVFRAVPELALDDLQQNMPELLDAILMAVSLSPYEYDQTPLDAAASRATAHGEMRATGFPVEVVLCEVQALQREVRNAIWRLAEGTPIPVIHELDDRLNEVFELVERSSVTGWVQRTFDQMTSPIHGEAA